MYTKHNFINPKAKVYGGKMSSDKLSYRLPSALQMQRQYKRDYKTIIKN